MASKVNLSKDGSAIEFKASESLPTTAKKFRQTPEIQGFYSFVYDNGLQRESYEILTAIINARKAKRAEEVAAIQAALEAESRAKAEAKAKAKAEAKGLREAERQASREAALHAKMIE